MSHFELELILSRYGMVYMSPFKRRDFLKFMGHASVAAGLTSGFWNTACSTLIKDKVPFAPLSPSRTDDFLLADGFEYDLLIKYNDRLTAELSFGTNNDFLHFTPLNPDSNEGVLWANHEYFHPVLIHNRKMDRPRTKQDMEFEQKTIGGSLVHLKKQNAKWTVVKNSKYNRRIDGTTLIPFHNNVSILNRRTAMGMVTNCGGGFTPWNTVLTCEENFDIFYGDSEFINKKRKFIPKDKMNWYEHFPNPPEHYGWVVEVNPLTGNAKKHTTLGRFEHEGATALLSKNGKVVVYMGEDRKGGGIFKFISENGTSLDRGTLYVANTDKGIWIPLDLNKNKDLQKHFDTQLDVLIYASYAAQVAGGTPQDRPEDIEINPITRAIIVSLTNNAERGNLHGGLLKIEENGGDHESMVFTSEIFKAGGPQNGFSCPDNLAFDSRGNLWMTTDMAEYDIRDGKFKGQGNNGLFYIPMTGDNAGRVLQVASAPIDAEFTGPTFSPDYKTLFLSIQHPGGATEDPTKPTSTWPERTGLPKSSVVAISGRALSALTT